MMLTPQYLKILPRQCIMQVVTYRGNELVFYLSDVSIPKKISKLIAFTFYKKFTTKAYMKYYHLQNLNVKCHD